MSASVALSSSSRQPLFPHERVIGVPPLATGTKTLESVDALLRQSSAKIRRSEHDFRVRA